MPVFHPTEVFMTDQTTSRAEQIREETGKPWELCCQQAERERDTAREQAAA